ncbi:hypothetical protein TNCT_324441 [Trichonephila clavata]|uniref:Uncharacterized protein n=1 Tax=Trichonephila clavata TaxID=2740835 RepID=A0A8X6J7M2_TRICU|nr:hypothetical protein TNCT_324441 [Trichonephila clavata]
MQRCRVLDVSPSAGIRLVSQEVESRPWNSDDEFSSPPFLKTRFSKLSVLTCELEHGCGKDTFHSANGIRLDAMHTPPEGTREWQN